MTEHDKIALAIDGVYMQPLRIIPAPGGPVLHLLRGDFALMPDFPDRFGEIYFSEILPGHIKGWKLHMRQTQLFAVPMGLIELTLRDTRRQSASYGQRLAIMMGRPDHYNLLQIPPGIWYSFRVMGNAAALLCNCANMPHDPAEARSLPIEEEELPEI